MFSHTTPILKSLHWLKINECIEYKLFSLTYEVLTPAQPACLYKLLSVQPSCHSVAVTIFTQVREQVLQFEDIILSTVTTPL